ncbi:MAG: chemotaxis protein CheX [Spirochaetes bacterium]|nr:chemotaxis protein CheX [Spirochaetota bacterium]
MLETELKAFIDVVIRYFSQVTGETVAMGVPYVKAQDPVLLDFTGVIGISGARRGCLCVTSPREMLQALAESLLGPDGRDEAAVADVVGEMANTIAGNAREAFGSAFMISVPVVLHGAPSDITIKLKPPVFVVPIQWRAWRSFLLIGLE